MSKTLIIDTNLENACTRCKYLKPLNCDPTGTFCKCTNENYKHFKDSIFIIDCGRCDLYEYDSKTKDETESESDSVKHPSHYCFGKYEPVKVISDWKLNFNLGCVIKYITRAGKKPGNSRLQDLQKAKQYLEFEIEEAKNNE